MTPIAQHIIITPLPLPKTTLVSLEEVYLNKAIVKAVSEDIKDYEVKVGDTVLYQTVPAIHLNGEVIIHTDFIPAIL
jgi:hypothetical protein